MAASYQSREQAPLRGRLRPTRGTTRRRLRAPYNEQDPRCRGPRISTSCALRPNQSAKAVLIRGVNSARWRPRKLELAGGSSLEEEGGEQLELLLGKANQSARGAQRHDASQ